MLPGSTRGERLPVGSCVQDPTYLRFAWAHKGREIAELFFDEVTGKVRFYTFDHDGGINSDSFWHGHATFIRCQPLFCSSGRFVLTGFRYSGESAEWHHDFIFGPHKRINDAYVLLAGSMGQFHITMIELKPGPLPMFVSSLLPTQEFGSGQVPLGLTSWDIARDIAPDTADTDDNSYHIISSRLSLAQAEQLFPGAYSEFGFSGDL